MPVQLRRGRAFVWLVECGVLGIFQRKGSFLEAPAKRERRGGWDHGCWCPLFFSSLFCLYHSVHFSGTLESVSRITTFAQSHFSSATSFKSRRHPPANHRPQRLTGRHPLAFEFGRSSCLTDNVAFRRGMHRIWLSNDKSWRRALLQGGCAAEGDHRVW